MFTEPSQVVEAHYMQRLLLSVIHFKILIRRDVELTLHCCP